MEFIRNCPNCNKTIVYSSKAKLNRANKKIKKCASCAKSGDLNPMWGKPSPMKGKQGLIGDLNPSKRLDVRIKISNSLKGKPSGMFGKNHSEETKRKQKESNTGQTRSQETKDKIRIKRKLQIGSKCPGWKGGITPIQAKIRNSNEYKNWRDNVFSRDKFKCKICKSSGYLHAHHIKSFSQNEKLRLDINNGLTLCKDCHNTFHNKYGLKNFPNILEIYSIKLSII